MRTSLKEIELIDGHLFNRNSSEDALLFEAMLLINPALANQVTWQKTTHTIIRQYSAKKLKAEIEAVHQKLFNESRHQSFRQRILSLFTRPAD